MTALWHLLLHAGVHLVNHLNKGHDSPTGCRRCQKTTGTMYTTNCCSVPLCASCGEAYNRASATTCPICSNPTVRR